MCCDMLEKDFWYGGNDEARGRSWCDVKLLSEDILGDKPLPNSYHHQLITPRQNAILVHINFIPDDIRKWNEDNN